MADISKQALRKEIAAILKDADLDGKSAKNVRLELEEKLDCKLISRKKEIDELVMEYVNKAADKKGKKKDDDEDEEDDDEDQEEDKESEDDDDSEEEKKPKRTPAAKKAPAKRTRRNSDDSDASDDSGDASEDEYKPTKKTPAKRGRKPAGNKKKSKGSDSDGDEDWVAEKASPRKSSGGGGAGKPKGFRPLTLSPELAALVGSEVMARHEVIKKMWSIIKEKNLYDPKNKQFAICDEQMQKVIGVKRFRMFGMMKYLKEHFITS